MGKIIIIIAIWELIKEIVKRIIERTL